MVLWRSIPGGPDSVPLVLEAGSWTASHSQPLAFQPAHGSLAQELKEALTSVPGTSGL